MDEPEVTCAAIVGFAEQFEDDTAKFYEKLASIATESQADFLSFSNESRKNKTLITRTYQETISDALEACFIKGLNLNRIAVKTLTQEMSFADALKMAIRLEEEAVEFYSETAKNTKSLLATIPMAFKNVGKKRDSRKARLESLLKTLI